MRVENGWLFNVVEGVKLTSSHSPCTSPARGSLASTPWPCEWRPGHTAASEPSASAPAPHTHWACRGRQRTAVTNKLLHLVLTSAPLKAFLHYYPTSMVRLVQVSTRLTCHNHYIPSIHKSTNKLAAYNLLNMLLCTALFKPIQLLSKVSAANREGISLRNIILLKLKNRHILCNCACFQSKKCYGKIKLICINSV